MNEQQKQFDDCTSSSLFSQVAQAERKKKLQTVTEAYKVMNTIFDRSTSARSVMLLLSLIFKTMNMLTVLLIHSRCVYNIYRID